MQKDQGIEPDISVKKLLQKIKKTVNKQQDEFGRIFREESIPLLKKEGIYLIDQTQINAEQKEFLDAYFKKEVESLLVVKILPENTTEFLENKGLYLAVESDLKN
ncbi:MAG: hypothetical protein QMB65_11650, partial [Vicingaceae bacterium]